MKKSKYLLILLSSIVFIQSCSEASNESEVLARLEALEAESEIRHKLQTYMAVLDAADWDTYINYFTHDATLIMAEGNREGREEIKERMSAASTRMANAAEGRPVRKSADLLANIEIQVNGDSAKVQSRFTFISETAEGGFEVRGSGLYIDEWAKEEGEWRISVREIDYDLL